MKVDEIISDEGVSGGVSYADRNLGKKLLPMMTEGDALIVSEVSRLGRSMFDLSKLIHDELKPRKLRLIVVGMGIDLNCANITPIDQLILSNFSFAAELEKHLIRERTLSALQVKKQQGVKLGAASEKYKENMKNKDKDELVAMFKERGRCKKTRWKEKKDNVVFRRILHSVFPDATEDENPSNWKWGCISMRNGNRDKVIRMMMDFKSIDGNLFKKWNFDIDRNRLTSNLCAYISTFKRSYLG